MKVTKTLQLDQDFWSRFSKTIWEQKPFAFKNVNSSLLELDSSEIFKLLVRLSDQCRKLKRADGFKLYINGEKLFDQDVLDLLPLKKDKSLPGYHLRMNQLFDDYCLVCDELLQVNFEKHALLKRFTDELYRHVGFPNRFSELGLYLGNYRRTPFGVHVDGCGVFSFPVVGTKSFRTWTPAFVKKNPNLAQAFEYSKYKKNSKLLIAGPGDMTYWPSSAWHIAESNGNFSATWSLGVWVDRPHRENVAEIINQLLSTQLNSHGKHTTTSFENLHKKNGQMSEIPVLYRTTLQILRRLSQSDLQNAFQKSWMQHVSKQGFKTLPRTELKTTLKIRPGTRLRLRNLESPILWFQPKNESKIYLSFGGVLVQAPNSIGLLKVVHDLNSGKIGIVPKFLSKSSTSQDSITLQNCLQNFADAGAFTKPNSKD